MDEQALILNASRAPDGRARIAASINGREIVADVCDLWSDEDRSRMAGVIHRECLALPIDVIERELASIDRDDLPTVEDARGSWEHPEEVARPDLPSFPSRCLPSLLADWVMAAAESYQVPSDLPGLLALAASSGMVARRFEVALGSGWIEPVNLFVCALLDPANRKSAVFKAAFDPVRSFERELIDVATPQVAKLQTERRIKEKQLATLEKKVADGKGDPNEAAELAAELALMPIACMPKLILDDATSEAVEIQLASQGGRLIVAGAEGGLFDVMAGRYSGGVNLDVFLKGHAGDDLRSDRVTRGSIVVDRCCLTLAYAVQPDVIKGLASKPSFRGRGLIGRFLYAMPRNILGTRRIDAPCIPDRVLSAYEQALRRLAGLGASDADPYRVVLSTDADRCFSDWRIEVERMLGDAGRLADLRDWGGKLCGLTARMACVMHLVECCGRAAHWDSPISPETIQRAIELSRWAIDHAEAVIGMMGAGSEQNEDAAYVLRWVRARGSAQVTRREIGQHGRARFEGDPERLDRCIMALMSRGWIRGIASSENTVGRPSERYEVNPRAFDRVADLVPVPSERRVRGVI